MLALKGLYLNFLNFTDMLLHGSAVRRVQLSRLVRSNRTKVSQTVSPRSNLLRNVAILSVGGAVGFGYGRFKCPSSQHFPNFSTFLKF